MAPGGSGSGLHRAAVPKPHPTSGQRLLVALVLALRCFHTAWIRSGHSERQTTARKQTEVQPNSLRIMEREPQTYGVPPTGNSCHVLLIRKRGQSGIGRRTVSCEGWFYLKQAPEH